MPLHESRCKARFQPKGREPTQDSLRSSPCRQHAAVGNLREHRRLTMTTQTYQQASQRFLTQAKAELAAGDLQQASEKG